MIPTVIIFIKGNIPYSLLLSLLTFNEWTVMNGRGCSSALCASLPHGIIFPQGLHPVTFLERRDLFQTKLQESTYPLDS